jgi:hypothetical protein
MKAKRFDLVRLLREREQNTLIWFKNFLSQAGRFHFGLKILGCCKAIWYDLEIVLGKVELFYVIQKLIDRIKTF